MQATDRDGAGDDLSSAITRSSKRLRRYSSARGATRFRRDKVSLRRNPGEGEADVPTSTSRRCPSAWERGSLRT